MYTSIKSTLIATAFIVLLAACQQAESPPEVRDDSAALRSSTEVENAIAKAEREHAVAIERCEVREVAERQLCKDQADAALNAAKDAAQGFPAPSQPQ